MPLELGIFLGASEFGDSRQRRKSCRVLDRDRYRYQHFVSDIAAHGNDPRRVIQAVRNWLNSSQKKTIPGPTHLWNRFQAFTAGLPRYCRDADLEVSELTFVDYSTLMSEWIIARGNFLEKPRK